MILAQKILNLRKKYNLSQEELAEKLKVSRQSVSKWESASSIPDVTKIIEMAKIFGVSTDYLLREDVDISEVAIEEEKSCENIISIEMANDFITKSRLFQKNLVRAIVCFILSVLPVVSISILGDESMYVVVALAGSFFLVLAGLALIFLNVIPINKFNYIEVGNFELSYGVGDILKEKEEFYTPIFYKGLITGIGLIFVATLSLLGIVFVWESIVGVVIGLSVFAIIVSIGVGIIVYVTSGIMNYQKLLKEREFSVEARAKHKEAELFSSVYWLFVIGGYLAWSFLSRSWEITWIVWPVAGVVYAAIEVYLMKKE